MGIISGFLCSDIPINYDIRTVKPGIVADLGTDWNYVSCDLTDWGISASSKYVGRSIVELIELFRGHVF